MQLPKNAATIADKFEGLSAERKQQIISHLAQVPDEKGNNAMKQIIKNGGPEADFVSLVFGIPIKK